MSVVLVVKILLELFPLEFTRAKRGTQAYELMVTGLKGGHSGLDAHQQRANGIKLLAQLLNKIDVPYQTCKNVWWFT